MVVRYACSFVNGIVNVFIAFTQWYVFFTAELHYLRVSVVMEMKMREIEPAWYSWVYNFSDFRSPGT